MEVRVSTLLVSVVVILSLTIHVVEDEIIVAARSRELVSTSILHGKSLTEISLNGEVSKSKQMA